MPERDGLRWLATLAELRERASGKDAKAGWKRAHTAFVCLGFLGAARISSRPFKEWNDVANILSRWTQSHRRPI
ncbi:MAG TPA: hypothetical protein VMT61_08910 [Candidatus Binataceae bacterium]|nr:hypothetical protein [Candidatus Binataceae bacterium]